MTEQREDRRISRRTIAKGAAWTIPLVPLVVATPAYAVSGSVTDRFLDVCKGPGNSCKVFPKGYIMSIEICNQTAFEIYVKAVSVTGGMLGGAPKNFAVVTGAGTTGVQAVPAGECAVFYVGLDDNGSSPNTSMSGTLNYKYWSPDAGEDETDAIVGDVPFSSPDSPECDFPTGPGGHCPPVVFV